MSWKRWVAFAYFCCAPVTFGQDQPKPEENAKPETDNRMVETESEAQKKFKLLQRQVQQSQESIQRAQQEAAAAHRQIEETLRDRISRDPRRFTVVREARRRPEPFGKVYGFDFVEIDPVLRSQLALAADEGLVVVVVTPGSQADKAGIKERDVITKIDLQPVSSVTKAREIVTKSPKKTVYFDLIREGKPVHLDLTKPENDPASQTVTYWIGTPVAPVDATLRSHLPELPADAGLIVTDVVNDSPAAKAGIHKYDILTRVNAKAVSSNEALIKEIQEGEGKELKLEVLRAGKSITLNVTPEKRVTPVSISPYNVRVVPNDGSREFHFYRSDDAVSGSQPRSTDRILITPNVVGDSIQVVPGGVDGVSVQQPPMHMRPAGGVFRPGITPDFEKELNARMDKEMKELSAKLEELRKMIQEMGKTTPERRDSPKNQ